MGRELLSHQEGMTDSSGRCSTPLRSPEGDKVSYGCSGRRHAPVVDMHLVFSLSQTTPPAPLSLRQSESLHLLRSAGVGSPAYAMVVAMLAATGPGLMNRRDQRTSSVTAPTPVHTAHCCGDSGTVWKAAPPYCTIATCRVESTTAAKQQSSASLAKRGKEQRDDRRYYSLLPSMLSPTSIPPLPP